MIPQNRKQALNGVTKGYIPNKVIIPNLAHARVSAKLRRIVQGKNPAEGIALTVRSVQTVRPSHCMSMTFQSITTAKSRLAGWPIGGAIVLWLCAIGLTWLIVADHERAGDSRPLSHVVPCWPRHSALPRNPAHATLLLFIHPKCPCATATLSELARTFDLAGPKSDIACDVVVVATVPPNADESWWNTDTIVRSQRLPNARLYIDRGGREADRFRVSTSGLVALFDEEGNRLFAGGVTFARGHEGANAGGDALAKALRYKQVEVHEIPVFGCRLCLPPSSLAGEPIPNGTQDRPGTNS
jgi:hypothetical protein